MKAAAIDERLRRLEVAVLPPPSHRGPDFIFVRDNESIAAARRKAGADEHTIVVRIVSTPKSSSTRPPADPEDEIDRLEGEVRRLEERRASLAAKRCDE